MTVGFPQPLGRSFHVRSPQRARSPLRSGAQRVRSPLRPVNAAADATSPPPKPPPAPSTEKKVVAEKDPDAVVIKLDNMNDHLKLVPLLLERFEAKKSKDSHVFMFVKELLKKTESRFSAAECGDLAIMAGNYQKTKQQAIDKPTESNAKKKSKKKSKKEKLEQKKKVDDLFGVAEAGEYDHYEDQYDDFF